MKKIIKNVTIILLLFILILLAGQKVFASDIANSLSRIEYSEEFKEWLELSDDEKEKVIMPRMYNIKNSTTEYKNPLFLTKDWLRLKIRINSFETPLMTSGS